MTTNRRIPSFDHALEFYHHTIKPQLSEADRGRFIAIDPATETWEVGEHREVIDKLTERVPDVAPAIITHLDITYHWRGIVPPMVIEWMKGGRSDAHWPG